MDLSKYDRAILMTLDEHGGFTTARVSRAILESVPMFGHNMRHHSGAVRSWLNDLRKRDMVRHLDELKPVCWCLTAAGRAALSSCHDNDRK